MFFILRSFLKRRKGLLSYLGVQRETHTKDGDGLLIIIIKKTISIHVYIYICRTKGSEDVNPSINSSYV